MQQTVDFSHLQQTSEQQRTARLPLLDVSGRIGRLEYFRQWLVGTIIIAALCNRAVLVSARQ